MNIYDKKAKSMHLAVVADPERVRLEHTDAHEVVTSIYMTAEEAIEVATMLSDGAYKTIDARDALRRISKAPSLSMMPVERASG